MWGNAAWCRHAGCGEARIIIRVSNWGVDHLGGHAISNLETDGSYGNGREALERAPLGLWMNKVTSDVYSRYLRACETFSSGDTISRDLVMCLDNLQKFICLGSLH